MSSVIKNPFARLGQSLGASAKSDQPEVERFIDLISPEQKHILSALPECIAVIEGNGVILFATDKRSADLDLTLSNMIGENFIDQINVADRVSYLKALSDCINEKTATEANVRVQGERKLRFCFNPYSAKSGGNNEHALALATIKGFSDTQMLLDDARAQAQEAVKRSEEASDLLATAGHELRTPLNAIIGFADILQNQSDITVSKEKSLEYAEYIHQASTSMLVLLNGILNVTKMDAGKLPLRPEPMDLCELVRSSTEFFRQSAASKDISLSYNFTSEVPQIVADKNALGQVVTNLISNAIKFSSQDGHVEITVGRIGRSVTIKVSDNGIGIKNEDVTRLGESYFQATQEDKSLSQQGSGLGLSIVKSILERHNARMDINSKLGAGTSVTVTLPICAQPSAVVPSNGNSDILNMTQISEVHEPTEITLNQRLA